MTEILDPSLDLQALQSLAAKVLPKMVWRHNGQGMLQAYLREGEGYESRIHIWYPKLRSPGIDFNGLIHNHRFDMSVTVLAGNIWHTEYDVQPAEHSQVEAIEVLHARAAKSETGSYHKAPVPTREKVSCKFVHQYVFGAGERYWFPKGKFHSSFCDSFAVTLVEKYNQEDIKARLIDLGTSPLIASFDSTIESAGEMHVIAQAAVSELEKLI